MLGSLIGDIVGSRFEGTGITLDDMEAGTRGDRRVYPERSSFTDDSICSCAIADALLHPPLLDREFLWERRFRRSLQTWFHRYPGDEYGYGSLFSAWARENSRVRNISAGNGAVMRVSAIAHLATSSEQAERWTRASVRPSHDHPLSYQAAWALVQAIRRLPGEGVGVLDALCQEAFGCPIPKLDLSTMGVSLRADDTVMIAFSVMQQAQTFEEAIWMAIRADRDSDTQACVVGGMAEVLYPPPGWIVDWAMERLPEDIQAITRAIAAGSRLLERPTARG